MDLRARTARACITHFPKVIMFVSVDDMVFRQVLLPVRGGLVITLQTLFRATFEYCCIQVFRIQFQDVYQIFPCPTDGFFLEVITERPVTQHFEHGVMVGIVSYFFKVIVLAAYTKALL